jgi:hypothetical protein
MPKTLIGGVVLGTIFGFGAILPLALIGLVGLGVGVGVGDAESRSSAQEAYP